MKDTTWSLDELYTSFNCEEFKKDLNQCEKKISEILLWTEQNFASEDNKVEKLEYYIDFMNQLGLVLSRLGEYCQLVLSTEADNSQALNALETIEDLEADLTPAETLFTSWISKTDDLDSILSTSPLILEHSFFLKELRENSKYLLSKNEEVVLAKMRSTGSLAWMKLWDTLTSTMVINIDGENYPLQAVRNLAYDKNPSLRKKAYDAELKALEGISQPSCAALNSIKGEVITTCKMRGYSSPLDMTLRNSRMDKDVLNAMIAAMKDYQPVLRKYLLKKASRLGHSNGLPFYDLFAPIGEFEMNFTYDEAKEFILKNFNNFSKSLGDYAKTAFDNRWIDVYPKEGKRGGAFCSNLHSIKESRILTNFSGSLNDVLTLAHELGHGFHGYCLRNESYINSDYPMPIAETASTFCETLVKNAALKTASDEQKLIILENDISDNVQIIVDILSRFLFEDEVFKRRDKGSLSVDELCNIMLDAQKATYGEGLDSKYLHKYMWVVKPHYYDVDYNYYNFPYAFGLLFAKGLYSIYLSKGEDFTKDYEKILGATGRNDHKDIALMAGIDITNPNFWISSLELIKNDVEKYLELA